MRCWAKNVSNEAEEFERNQVKAAASLQVFQHVFQCFQFARTSLLEAQHPTA